MTGTLDDRFTVNGEVEREMFRGDTCFGVKISVERQDIRDGQGNQSNVGGLEEIPLDRSMEELGLYVTQEVLVEYVWDGFQEQHRVSEVSIISKDIKRPNRVIYSMN